LPQIAALLASPDALTARCAAAVMRDVAVHGPGLAQQVSATPDCLSLLIEHAAHAKALNKLPAIMALGFLSGADQNATQSVVAAGALPTLVALMREDNTSDPVRCAAAWALGQIGKQCTSCAVAVADSGKVPAASGCSFKKVARR
jgi:Armadillo/beta-catenin-like repeat